MADNTASTTPLHLRDAKTEPRAHHYSPARLATAFAIAAASDVASFWADLLPPVQWAIDLTTALLLFLVLGRRWAILPGLITEAIPGMGVFPVWVLVVLSVFVYDKVPRKSEVR